MTKFEYMYPENTLVISTVKQMLQENPENRPLATKILNKISPYDVVKNFFAQSKILNDCNENYNAYNQNLKGQNNMLESIYTVDGQTATPMNNSRPATPNINRQGNSITPRKSHISRDPRLSNRSCSPINRIPAFDEHGKARPDILQYATDVRDTVKSIGPSRSQNQLLYPPRVTYGSNNYTSQQPLSRSPVASRNRNVEESYQNFNNPLKASNILRSQSNNLRNMNQPVAKRLPLPRSGSVQNKLNLKSSTNKFNQENVLYTDNFEPRQHQID